MKIMNIAIFIFLCTLVSGAKINVNGKFPIILDKGTKSNISFTLEDTQINKNDIIKKMLETDTLIDEKLFEDLYYNENFSKKINVELPKNYNNKKIILEDIEIEKTYLFKVEIIELNRNFHHEI